MDRSQLVAIIHAAAARQGVDPATLLRIGEIESGLNPNDRASRSSATGLFQLTRAGWKDYGQGGDPLDPESNANAGARMTAANIAGLKASGYDVSPRNVYLAHFSGLGGARGLLRADPNAPVASVLSAEALKANPEVLGGNKTVGDILAWADRQMAGGPQSLSSGAAPAPQQQEGSMPPLTLDQMAYGAPGGVNPLSLGAVAAQPDGAQQGSGGASHLGMLADAFGNVAQGLKPKPMPRIDSEPMAMPIPQAMRGSLVAAILQRGGVA